MWTTSSLDRALTPSALALGNFDGIHQGHCQVITALRNLLPPASQRIYTTVVAFDPHPHAFFSGQPQPLLTPLSEKVELLEQLGVEQLVLLPFNQALSQLSPQAFVEQILIEKLAAQAISVGFNFQFGHQRAGTAEDLRAIAAPHQISVSITAPQTSDNQRISSSAIRETLQTGQLAAANRMLGRPYTLTGTVIHGQHLGRTLGFPTANLQLPADKFLPRQGVYSVRVNSDLWPQAQLGVMNFGCRPTVQGEHPLAEVHLFDWSGDLYGHTVTVSLEQFLRPEQTFASLDDLKQQIQVDCETARSFLTSRV